MAVHPVVGIDDAEVLARGNLERSVDAGAVVSVGLVDDDHRLRIALLVVVGDCQGTVLAAVIDDDNLELFQHLVDQHGVHATMEVLLHVVTRDADA